MDRDGLALFSLSDKVAAVTGAAGGIGQSIAEALAGAGARVYCLDIDEAGAVETAGRLQRMYGSDSFGLAVDIADMTSVTAVFSRICNEAGSLDILFNMAGVASREYEPHAFPEAEWQRLLQVNLTGTFNCCKCALESMLKQQSGKIVNMCSTISERGSYNGKAAGMCAARAGIMGLTKDMAVCYAQKNIQINAIAPGFIRTEIGKTLYPELDYEQLSTKIFADAVHTIPAGRVAEPSELKGTALFLASSASDYISGHILYVDGGLHAK